MDVEKGRDNCRKYVEERKLIRVAKESGLTTDEVIQGVATGALQGEANGSAEVVAIDVEGKGKDHDY